MAPLWQLCKEEKLAEVREALARGEDANGKGEGNLTALMWAIMYNGDKEIVKLLLEQPTVDLNYSDKSGQTALHKVGWALGDNVDAVKMLLADPCLTTHNHKNKHGRTPAISAALFKNTLLRKLVAHPKVDLDIKDQIGRSLEEVARWT